jgi:hypothetical protein
VGSLSLRLAKQPTWGSFEGVPELITAIKDYVDQSNQNPHVFVWTASAESIMAKIAKCKEALDARCYRTAAANLRAAALLVMAPTHVFVTNPFSSMTKSVGVPRTW